MIQPHDVIDRVLDAFQADLVMTHGADALESAFERAQPDLFSIDRASVPIDPQRDA
ncbi:hypothetical protein [Microbacterium mitrae]|uniref:hypothetical protein n=1 Tax=Microbacterium mitrae TaxID=664640 RepID=UPI00164FD6EB|nr:hypothetical protein [Microbacterium mitrae]